MAKGPPNTVTLGHDDYSARYVGRTADGRQFFLTNPFVPAIGGNSGREFLALYLFDAYQQAIAPQTAAGDYAREVLEEAYRRGFTQAGIRMQQLGECGAEREELTTQFIAIRDELADLRRRAEAAAKRVHPLLPRRGISTAATI